MLVFDQLVAGFQLCPWAAGDVGFRQVGCRFSALLVGGGLPGPGGGVSRGRRGVARGGGITGLQFACLRPTPPNLTYAPNFRKLTTSEGEYPPRGCRQSGPQPGIRGPHGQERPSETPNLEGVLDRGRPPVGLVRSARRDPRDARHRPVRAPRCACHRRQRGGRLVGPLGGARRGVRRRHLVVGGLRVRRPVLRRLPHREVAGGRQRLRLGHHLQLLRRASAVPAPGAVLRCHRRPDLPWRVHRGGLGSHRLVRVDPLPLRRVPAGHRLHDDQEAGRPHRPVEVQGRGVVQAVRARRPTSTTARSS